MQSESWNTSRSATSVPPISSHMGPPASGAFPVMTIQCVLNQPPVDVNLHVFFVPYAPNILGSSVQLAQAMVAAESGQKISGMTDPESFTWLRNEYCACRRFLAAWFRLSKYSHCDFFKAGSRSLHRPSCNDMRLVSEVYRPCLRATSDGLLWRPTNIIRFPISSHGLKELLRLADAYSNVRLFPFICPTSLSANFCLSVTPAYLRMMVYGRSFGVFVLSSVDWR